MKVNVSVKPHKKETVTINTDFIRLDAFLKFKGIAQTGGHAKILIQDGDVIVNGDVCLSRGKKLKNGDEVSFESTDYIIKNENWKTQCWKF